MDFTIRRCEGNENVENYNRSSRQNNSYARASYVFVHFFAVFARLPREMPGYTFQGGRKRATTKFYSLSKLEYSS